MIKYGWGALVGMMVLGLLACQKESASGPATGKPLSAYSDEAIVITKDLERKMKGTGGDQEAAQSGLNHVSEDQLYNPAAKIEVQLIAHGGYGPAQLLAEARKTEPNQYAMALVMTGLQNASQAENADTAREEFRQQYQELLDYLRARKIPTVVSEILPVVEAYQKDYYKMPVAQVNELIGKFNQELYGLALEKAEGFMFTSRVFTGRVNGEKDSLILNVANSGAENGIQPTVEGMRRLAELSARALHKAGYRNGRILVLGDSVLGNEALSRSIDKLTFLLPKYLEIELHKTCP